MALERARSLEVGDEALCFGRTDHDNGDCFYIGRRAVFDHRHEPIVIDWRVPSAEPFYRATGRHPLGLVQRRHFLCEGRRLLAIEDEHFGADSLDLAGGGVLLAAMERPRTGHMRDIVATVQAEQDEVIRDDLAGILAVQGGPGTGKTAVALHRAAFLLFTHRRKLGQQGMLVVGPNRRFLRYIDQVLPALGEGGVLLATLADLAPRITVESSDPWAIARLKGDARMATVIARAVRDRQRHVDRDTTITLDGFPLRLRAQEVNALVSSARRNRRSHNARRSMLFTILVAKLFTRYTTMVKKKHGKNADIVRMSRREASRQLRAHPDLNEVMDAAWPLLTPQGLVAELLSSRAHLDSAAKGVLQPDEIGALHRGEAGAWTAADVPLLDEAFSYLGEAVHRRRVVLTDEDDDEVTTYGHIIVDEAQDLPPMALRMVARRSRTGSITIVGDLAQSAGPSTPESWDVVLSHLPQRDGTRIRPLTVNYRTPGPVMDVAARILSDAAPHLQPPTSARTTGDPITFIEGDPAVTVARLADEQRGRARGTMVIIAARSQLADMANAARATDDEEETIAVLSVEEAKGLEFDQVVVVEPARIAAEAAQGLRALYIAITRATQHVTVAHAEPLPKALIEPALDGTEPATGGRVFDAMLSGIERTPG